MKGIIWVTIILLTFVCLPPVRAQSLPTDLQPVSASDVPVSAHTWISIQNFGSWPELPFLWLDDGVDVQLYISPSVGLDVVFVDDSAISYPGSGGESHGFGMHSNYYLSGDGSTDNAGYWTYGTNDLWLELVGATNDPPSAAVTAGLVIHAPTPSVYDIFYAESLPATNGWYWLARAMPGETNIVIPGVLTNSGFFILGTTNGAVDPVTGLTAACMGLVGTNALTNDFNGNGVPDIWEVSFFGGLRPGTNDYNGNGVDNFHEYLNGTDPNTITFFVEPTNQYCISQDVSLPLLVTEGVPSATAVLVDSTNFTTALWTNYSPAAIANLPSSDGWHQIWIGLRGRSASSEQSWQTVRIKLDRTAPGLTITNPVAATVDRPVIQLQGFCPKALASLTYDVANVSGLVTNQLGMILHQAYDTNTLEFSTNYFQCFDVPLSAGSNTITLHATDLAGNTTNVTLAYNLDYSGKTNPPPVQLVWPLDATQIAGSNFTWRGWISDPTAQVTAQIVNTNGITNIINGVVDREGYFRIPGLPLGSGTNTVTLTAMDAASNQTATNIAVAQSDLGLTIDYVDFWSTSGTISDTNHTVWVNGVQADIYDYGFEIDWSADLSLSLDNFHVQARAIPNADTPESAAPSSVPNSSESNPTDPQAVDTESDLDVSVGVVHLGAYNLKESYHSPPVPPPFPAQFVTEADWQEEVGGGGFYNGDYGWNDFIYFAAPYPQEIMGISIDHLTGLTNGVADIFPDTCQNHCDDSYNSSGEGTNSTTWQQMSDGEMVFNTGGGADEVGKGLFFFTAWAASPVIDLPIPGKSFPPEQISLGGLGNLDANGYVAATLPLHSKVDVTPKVAAKQYQYDAEGSRYTLVPTCSAPVPADNHRTTIGVGEWVVVTLTPPKGTVLPSYIGSLVHWTTSAGSLSNSVGLATLLYAPSNAATATVTMHYHAVEYAIDFKVVEPTNVVRAEITDTWCFNQGDAAAGMWIRPYIGPTNVSFYRVQLEEVPQPATGVSGYFLDSAHPAGNHDYAAGAGHFDIQLGCDNSWPSAYDKAYSAVFPPSASNPRSWNPGGGFTWHIPAKWKIDNGPTNDLSGSWDQVFNLQPDGTVTVSKFGYIATRHINQTCSVITNSP